MSYRITIMACLFVTCLITANTIAVKLLALPFGLQVPMGIIVFPLAYAFNDLISEVYGFVVMRRVILLGFACNALFVFLVWIGGILPAPSFWTLQGAYTLILGYTFRLLIASFTAYLVGQFVNAQVLVRMKVWTNGRYLWTRTIGSTALGEALDTCIFVLVAFYGVIPTQLLATTILAQWIIKVAYEVLATPMTYWLVAYLRRHEA